MKGSLCGRFNGAATWKSRKVRFVYVSPGRSIGFNGAATWKSRKVDRAFFQPRTRDPLQWGRDLEVAESHWVGKLPLVVRMPLQWGRDLEVAESRDCRWLAGFDGRLLQWGRDLEVAESRKEWHLHAHLDNASMGPRLGSRGKLRLHELPSRKRTSFNGAATWKSRKAKLPKGRGYERPSFNGAATWKSRKDGKEVEARFRDDASMGPRLGSRGKRERIQTGSRLHHASMGPRLGSRGKIRTEANNASNAAGFNGAATWKSRKARVR